MIIMGTIFVKHGYQERRTLRMVEIKTEFALDRQRKVVFGFVLFLAASTARFMAGCFGRVS